MKKSRVVKSWSKLNVPEEIWTEILSRLPVKSLLRFRCVCSSWRALIDDPNFRRLHLTRFKNNHSESRLFFVQRSKCWSKECVSRCSKTLRITARLGFLETDLPSSDTIRTTPTNELVQHWAVSCWIDGLFMLKDKTYKIPKLMLWNPSIRKTRILSLPPEILSERDYFDFGLGFDPLIEDYKFVRFILGRGAASVYTLGTNSWKTVDLQGEGSSSWYQDVQFPEGQKTFCLRGILYALARNRGSSASNLPLFNVTKLVSFDFHNEMLACTPLPLVDDPESHWHSWALTMVDDGSSLAVVNLFKNKGSIWVMQNLGDDIKSLSWTQRCSFALLMPETNFLLGRPEFLYLKKNGEMVFQCPMLRAIYDKCMLTSYNLETQKENLVLKEIILEDNTWPYMESLILL